MSTVDTPSTEQVKERVRQKWSDAETVALWRKWRPHFALQTQPLTAALVQAAQVRPGMQVLDLASGAGEPAFTLAHVVGPHGHVTASDLSPGMVAVIEEYAREHGLTNLTCRQADAEALPFPDRSFHVVTCRLGVMFFVNVAQALREIWRVLTPGGRAALLVWGPQSEQARYASTYGVVLKYVDVPPPAPDEPTPYEFAQPGTLTAALRDAGLQQVDEVSHRLVLPWPGSPEEFCAHVCDFNEPFRRALESLPLEKRTQVTAEVHTALWRNYDGQRVNLPATVHVATGVR